MYAVLDTILHIITRNIPYEHGYAFANKQPKTMLLEKVDEGGLTAEERIISIRQMYRVKDFCRVESYATKQCKTPLRIKIEL